MPPWAATVWERVGKSLVRQLEEEENRQLRVPSRAAVLTQY